ncbi:GntR family transcriptional regulator [Cryobacterium roopkundense]|uniref:DNA-binding transcriptional MocR family regulator n=1 Tax=Cryobacterium roopkundense TaxID=1001240 RepID=A0A099J5N9_9MICO|nr:PLP-dependent aminotransferase family protein [Cryobacterium roopkundense]KGJ72832.1 GntR family transcriptional regulator [Cryobacterium roopkundense]MBB5642868.1 DNA-binding transcriptional MocR family regulator [Cryobacterium roopkundense]
MSENHVSARALETLLGQWRGGASAYLALSDRIRLLALDGRLPSDSRLPAERDLSLRLGVSRTTVTAAYRQLREAGYVNSVRGSGSVVRLPGASAPAPTPEADGILDFSKATMPALPGLADAAAYAVAELPRHLGDSGFDPVGIPELRAAIADRFTARGLPTCPEQIMVTLGAQHAIALLARVLVGRGDRALIETPTYPHAAEALRAAGARLAAVSVSAGGPEEDPGTRGWDEPSLLQTLQRSSPVVGYLMPDFHNPTGQSMPVEQRELVASAAADSCTTLIIDETIAELTIDRQGDFPPFAACADARSAPHIVSVGSVGKTVWGGMRIGWIRAEPGLIHKLVAARCANDLGTPILEQLIVARLLTDMPAILAGRRGLLRVGRDHLERRLADTFPNWHVPHVDGGITAWVNLGSPVSSQLALAARSHGLLVPAGPRFGLDGAFERFLRMPFSHSVAETDRAVDALEAAWGSLGRHPFADTGSLAEVV